MTYKKDICVSKTRNIWIDYEHNHMFYITNLMDILPPEIAENIWKTYWKYEYLKNFVNQSMWKHLYMNRIKWAVRNQLLMWKKREIQHTFSGQDVRYLHTKCGYLKKNGKHCENCYANNVYDTNNHRDIKRLIGNTKQLYNIEGGFLNTKDVGWADREDTDLPNFVKPKVCGTHSKKFDLTDYVHGLGYKMRNGYLCKTKGTRYYYLATYDKNSVCHTPLGKYVKRYN